MNQLEELLAAVIVALALAVGGFFYGQHVGKAEAAQTQLAIQTQSQVAYNAGQTDAARQIAVNQLTYADMQKALHEQLAADHVYDSCRNSTSVMQLLEAASHNRPVPAGLSGVPGKSPPTR